MYDWNQTPKTITIKIPIPYKIDSKKFESQITDTYLKLNILDPKIFKFIDLYDKVVIDSVNLVIEDKQLIYYINKLTEENWPFLESKLPKDQLKIRRLQSEENYNNKIQENRQKAQERKKDLEKFVVDKSMKLDEEKRKELKEKKEKEKSGVENDLYDFVKKYDEKETNISKINHSKNFIPENKNFEKNETEINQKNKEPNNLKENDLVRYEKKIGNFDETKEKNLETKISEESSSLEIYDKNINKNKKIEAKDIYSNEIFDEVPIIEKNKSQIRPQANFNVNLTEKKIPHFAARESLAKEPPYPKSKNFVPEKNHLGIEIEDRNPIWTKERADNLVKNRDFKTAISVYNRALELDPEFHKVYLNRATCYMLIGDFDSALNDLQYLRDLIAIVEKTEIEDPFYQKLIIKTYIKTYAIYGFKGEFKKALESIEKIRECKAFLEEKILEKINKDQLLLERRLNAEPEKLNADELLKSGNLEDAEKMYLKILENLNENIINQNEKILSNLSLIYLNLEKYDKCISYCGDIIKIIRNFKEKFSFNKYDNTFEIKILLRRAKSYEKINDIKQAQLDIEAAERLEIRNELINKDINNIKNDLKFKILEKFKETANKFLEQGQFSEALEYYDKSISLAKFLPKIEGLKLYLNRCSCLIKLGQFENSIDECSRIMSILIKQKNIAIINSNLDLLDKIKQLEFLTFVKRAYVYTQTKKIFEAIQDYDSALEIKPDDKKIKENLSLLKASF